ncbi:histidine kinase N-terminal 7TM domain-containing protein [Halorubrum sp. DTA46]|uniref:histidine kinase N-terminal 7TM domain-containing protein n=1 Tax=Halorubrum sp. DTA46 TaxID=3402162 RepID=UPI003AADAA50
MEWQPTPYTAPLLVAAAASFSFLYYALSQRSRDRDALVWTFVAVTLGCGIWSLAYATQLSAVTLEWTLFWNRFVWIGVGLLAAAWPAFVLAYVDLTRWLQPRRLALLCLVPTATMVGVLAFGADALFYQSPTLVSPDGYNVMAYTPTASLIGFIAYTYCVNLVTFAVLGYAALVRDGMFRRQAGVLLLAGVAPMAAGVLGLWGRFGPTFVDFTPVAFALTSAAVGWVVFKHRLFDISPVARDAVFANLSDGVVVVDGEGRIVDCNGPARGLFPSVAVGRCADDAFAEVPAVADAVTPDGDGSGPTDRRVTDEFHVTLDDGSAPRFLTADVHAIADGSGVGGCVLLLRDITERETLQRRYRALIEKSPNVIAVCGTDGLLRYVSPSVERLLGYTSAEIEGRPIIDLVHPDDQLDAQRAFERAFDSGDPQPIDHRIAHANGNWRLFETVIERLFDDTEELVITATDVTENRRYEQRLQVLNRVLRHDLKNDTNVIGGYADLLRDHVDDEGDEYLDVIDRKVETLTHLSDQARQIDVALHSSVGRATIDLSELVARLGESLESSFPHATVTVSCPDSAVVCADELLESAVRNVLENAVVHNDEPEPVVEASVAADGDGFYIGVADNGPGIPPVERAVFSEARETALEHASGLGLWLVHWIVTESGGDLDIETREPRGTLVTMWLPAAEES